MQIGDDPVEDHPVRIPRRRAGLLVDRHETRRRFDAGPIAGMLPDPGLGRLLFRSPFFEHLRGEVVVSDELVEDRVVVRVGGLMEVDDGTRVVVLGAGLRQDA